MAQVRIAVTGPPACGKTTLVRRVAERLKARYRVGGFYTEEIRAGGKRVGFALVDLATGERGTLARTDRGSGPRVGRYRVCLRDLESIGLKALKAALGQADMILVDEIAPMELSSPRFAEAVQELLHSSKPLLFAIHRRARGPLLEKIRRTFRIFEVTPENRDGLVDILCSLLTQGASGG